MVKRLEIESACNIVTVILMVALTVIACVNAEEMWELPTALDIQTALESCHVPNLSVVSSQDYLKKEAESGNGNIRCIGTVLKLWSDEEGFIAKRFVKLFSKYHKPMEIAVVVDYCNTNNKQMNLNKWADEAYYCFAQGRMGKWLRDYIKNVYKKKTLLNI